MCVCVCIDIISLRWQTRKSPLLLHRLPALLCLGSLLVNFGLSAGMSFVSSYNYPGGCALELLHQLYAQPQLSANVYYDTETSMTGASRFLELRQAQKVQALCPSWHAWNYTKGEHFSSAERLYTHVITAHPQEFLSQNYEVVKSVEGFAGVKWHGLTTLFHYSWTSFQGIRFGPIEIRLEPQLFILELREDLLEEK